MTTHRVCRNCGLAEPEEVPRHETLEECIKAMQSAMVRQRDLAQNMGMDMSMHFLRALEELSIRPDVGYRYTVWNPEEGKAEELPAQQVSGIFASLLKAYREQANFRSDDEEKKVTAYWAMVAGKLGGLVVGLLERYEINEEDTAVANVLLEQASANQMEGPSTEEVQRELQLEQIQGAQMEGLLRECVHQLGPQMSEELRQSISVTLERN